MYRLQYKRQGKKKKYHKEWLSSVQDIETRLRTLCCHHIEAMVVDQDRNVVGRVVAAGSSASWRWWCNRGAAQ
jgi:hypothetical protein